MYLDALSFLEDEREAFRPFEALATLPDAALERPVEGAHGWSGRQLMVHLLVWQEVLLDIARELAVGETSATLARTEAEWARRGDAMNDELHAAWDGRPTDEVRARYQLAAGELRGYLTVVPESRWIKHPTHLRTFIADSIEHYDEHLADLEAVLAANPG